MKISHYEFHVLIIFLDEMYETFVLCASSFLCPSCLAKIAAFTVVNLLDWMVLWVRQAGEANKNGSLPCCCFFGLQQEVAYDSPFNSQFLLYVVLLVTVKQRPLEGPVHL